MKKTVFVSTNGCPENRIDCAVIEQYFLKNGLSITNKVEIADIVIFNACGLTKETEETSIRRINKLNNKKRRNSRLIVCGCLPKINRERIYDVYTGDMFGGASINDLEKLLGIRNGSNSIHANYLVESYHQPPSVFDKIRYIREAGLHSIVDRIRNAKYRKLWKTINIVQPNTYYIKVSSGCENACSYCAVKISRGAIKSKSLKKIKYEFIKGLESGYTKYALIGTDLGSYGKDIQTDLLELLKELILIQGKYQIKLRNVHPRFLIENLKNLLDLLKSGKISHITTAIQSGSNRILSIMKRGYVIEDCKFAINSLKINIPNLTIRTQLMVGFPGETDSDFVDTCKVVNEGLLDFVEVYRFSPRPKTLSIEMPHQVPLEIAYKRKFMLKKIVLEKLKTDPISCIEQLP
jgi:MiaB/RimO family radical SAM methylthiotransferase